MAQEMDGLRVRATAGITEGTDTTITFTSHIGFALRDVTSQSKATSLLECQVSSSSCRSWSVRSSSLTGRMIAQCCPTGHLW